jgi:hypothetical protein
MTITGLRVPGAFDTQVETWAAQALQAGSSSFPELLARLPGVYPVVALDALYRMHRNGQVSAGLLHMLERQARSYGHAPPLVLDPLPPPHPLDFEWRFTKRTAIKLLSLAETLANPDERVVLLGTPTIAAMAASSPIDRATVFIGEDNVITRAVMAQNDLNDRPLIVQTCKSQALFPREAGVVVVDSVVFRFYATDARLGGIMLPRGRHCAAKPVANRHTAKRGAGSRTNPPLSSSAVA